jgi:hypothetical protein
MKFSLKLNCAVIFSCAIFISCNSPSQNKVGLNARNNTKQNDSTISSLGEDDNSQKIPEKTPNLVKADLVCVNSMDESENPKSDVSVIVNGKKTKVQSVVGEMNPISKNEYSDYQIPQNAISAFGGWWAGAGDYFYISPSSNGIIVFHGWQDESQEDTGYHWEKIKEINF